MKTVYIAEKPDIATAIAAHLWSDYASLRSKHCYGKGDVIVTWAYGHIMMTAMPEAYDKEYANFNKYPIIPSTWKKLPSPTAKEQFDYIKRVLKETDLVINGGDPDREGQLLIDEILEFVHFKGEVRRILINAKDADSMKRAFDNIVSNDKFKNLYHAGLARERADWLVGINLSRAYTVNADKSQGRNVWRVGRVKVPTLALVVQREKEIRNFKSVNYYVLTGKYSKSGIPFSATLQVPENVPSDSEGRVLDKSYLSKIQKEVENKEAKVTAYDAKVQTENPPLPYSLDTLQVEANKRFGMSPSLVLDKVQSLYEKKFVSYPRSDCNFIPKSQHGDATRILKSLEKYGVAGASEADTAICSRCFDDSKVSAHHALIPTGVVPSDLDQWEKSIYEMISTRYIIQFFPACKYNVVSYEISAEGYKFVGSGKTIVTPGWRAVAKQSDDENKKSTEVPNLKVGDAFPIPIYIIEEKKTTAPKRFTEGTLLAAMTNIWRFVSADNPNREKLKECKGIGTPATRDTIISELMANKSGKATVSPCIEKKGKELVPTDFGIAMIDNIHESLTKPDFTAIMEYNLSSIAEGKVTLEDFMKETTDMVLRNIKYAEDTAGTLQTVSSGNVTQQKDVPNVECPVCHRQTLARKYSPKNKKYFWICEEKSCVHPTTRKPIFFDDMRKKPLVKVCPQCHEPLNHVYSSKTKQYYWFCPKCNEFKKMN